MSLLNPIEQNNKNNAYHYKLSLKNRLWLFQILLVFLLLICIFPVLIAMGVITSFNNNSHVDLKRQLFESAKNLSHKCSVISTNSVELANKIDKSIEKNLSSKGLSIPEIKSNPQLLETILGNEVEKSIFTMQKTGVSGVFVFLDATINPNLNNALDSKAGFYIVDMYPDVTPYSTKTLFLLSGFPSIARENAMYLHTEWELEIDVGIQIEKSMTNFYNNPYTAAVRNKGANLQDLGYWSPFFKPTVNSEQAMSYSVPLIDKNGVPYGICGLEISRSIFEKFIPPPVSPEFENMTLLFSTLDSKGINMQNSALISNDSSWLTTHGFDYLYSLNPGDGNESHKKYYFDESNKDKILGLETKVSLYPSKTLFKEEKWVLAALVPTKSVKKLKQFLTVVMIFLLLFILGIVVSYYTSRHYIEPIVNTLSKIKESKIPLSNTNIPEIDDFIVFLEQSAFEHGVNTNESVTPITEQTASETDKSHFEEFNKRLKTLTRAEREVFNLYIQKHSAKEISQMLFVSINTVKSHNKKIFLNMNVSSRVELLAYCLEYNYSKQEK